MTRHSHRSSQGLCTTFAVHRPCECVPKERGKQADACESGDQWNQTDDCDHDTPGVMDDQEPKSDQLTLLKGLLCSLSPCQVECRDIDVQHVDSDN